MCAKYKKVRCRSRPNRNFKNERKNVAAAEKQLESIGYRFTQEIGRWPFLNPRLEVAKEQTSESAPPLIKPIWNILEEQLEGRFVTGANEITERIMRRSI